MKLPILATKLYKPKTKANRVRRSRLLDHLSAGLERKITLVSAPAGFGKTTLVSTWLTGCDVQSAWLSLDENDRDLTRFLTYFVAALQTLNPAIGQDLMSALQSPQPPSPETLATMIVNDISTFSAPFILVLDDYHLIDSKAVDEVLSFLLEHQPQQLHLVMITREDPQLPLPRLRVRNELSELRASDLRFTESEVSSFLNQVMGLELSAEAIAMLETRTEGWIAGLQMAALSMQGRSDAAGFIRAFTGSHHFVLDYLLEEVLQQQPAEIQSFLLQTSILERLQASLCEAVTQDENAQGILETLERSNLFVLPLDDERTWYRYHHLFADVLQARLKNEYVDVRELHQRASQWYEQHGFITEAIRHALVAHDTERIAALIERNWPTMRKNRQEVLMLSWLKTLPDDLFEVRPVLSTIYALVLINRREYEQADLRLQAAEVWLDAKADLNEMIVIDEAQFQSLAATIANARAHRAQALGDISGSIFHAEKALELLQEEGYERAITASLLGLAYWAHGDLAAAEQSIMNAIKTFEKSGNDLITVGFSVVLAQVMMLQGKLRKAEKIYQQALEFVAKQGEANGQGALNLYRGLRELHYFGLSELHYSWGDLETAKEMLHKGEHLDAQTNYANLEYHCCIAKARLEGVEGNIENALELLDKAELLFEKSPVPDVRPISAQRARLWIKGGTLQEALAWAREQNLSSKDELSYLLEFEHITLARLLLAQFRQEKDRRYLDEAINLLARLLKETENGRTTSAIEILILQAVALEAKGDTPAALTALQKALTLAEPEGYVQIFVNEDEPIAGLINEIAKRTKPSTYLRQLQAAFKPAKRMGKQTKMTFSMLEPLSERELEVLKMLRSELSGPDIARHLGVSLNTLRTHTKNIYSKLEVNNRRVAVNRAEELGLL